ncbi:urease accessory UreF family protein [Micromonospora sp. NPDC049523]|uniref:urease accessory protein UreF n=1 Tax=Micromonospora sp. NPDC049523 TaxID=3155921 RepID=UPI003439D7AD
MSSLATLLVLADGRLPAGSHAHSGGLESAVASGRLRDLAGLAEFLRGRLATTGRVGAAFAASACAGRVPAADLDDGLDTRTPSPALRRVSRAQGRALVRAGRAIFGPVAVPVGASPTGLHQPVALGLVAAAAGLSPTEAAVASAYGSVSGPASAAVRLLGLDPYAVHALLAGLAGECDRLAADAAGRVDDPVDDLPADSAVLLEIGAELHASQEVRLFAS